MLEKSILTCSPTLVPAYPAAGSIRYNENAPEILVHDGRRLMLRFPYNDNLLMLFLSRPPRYVSFITRDYASSGLRDIQRAI